MTLQEAVQQAIATNPDIGIVASNREAVDQELRQARGLYLPQIDVAAGVGLGTFNDSTSRRSGGDTAETVRRTSSIPLPQRLFARLEAGETGERAQARVEFAANTGHTENSRGG